MLHVICVYNNVCYILHIELCKPFLAFVTLDKQNCGPLDDIFYQEWVVEQLDKSF